LRQQKCVLAVALLSFAPKRSRGDPDLSIEKKMRWRVAGAVAGRSANPQRIAELEAYETRDVPVDARKSFLAVVASIQENQRIVKNVLPQIDAWSAAQQPAPSAQAGLKAGT
jgi:hypothetical protein